MRTIRCGKCGKLLAKARGYTLLYHKGDFSMICDTNEIFFKCDKCGNKFLIKMRSENGGKDKE